MFDPETTGLNPRARRSPRSRPVRVTDGAIHDAFQTYVNPAQAHSRGNYQADRHFRMRRSRTRPTSARRSPNSSLGRGGRYPLVAHNAGFDMGFSARGLQAASIEREFTAIDTLEMSRMMLPHLHKFKLNIPAKELQVGPVRGTSRERGRGRAGAHLRQLLARLREEMYARTVADINPVLAATTDRKNKLKNLPRYHFIILVKTGGGGCATCTSSSPRVFSNTTISGRSCRARADPPPRGADLWLGMRGGRGVPAP